jgi:hypothetical protein
MIRSGNKGQHGHAVGANLSVRDMDATPNDLLVLLCGNPGRLVYRCPAGSRLLSLNHAVSGVCCRSQPTQAGHKIGVGNQRLPATAVRRAENRNGRTLTVCYSHASLLLSCYNLGSRLDPFSSTWGLCRP